MNVRKEKRDRIKWVDPFLRSLRNTIFGQANNCADGTSAGAGTDKGNCNSGGAAAGKNCNAGMVPGKHCNSGTVNIE